MIDKIIERLLLMDFPPWCRNLNDQTTFSLTIVEVIRLLKEMKNENLSID